MPDDAPVVIIGSGLVGLSTAFAYLKARPGARVELWEKEETPAFHQSGHNSGVIHSGVYYRPGSHKARLCKAGRGRMIAFAEGHGVRHEICGKVIVANGPSERSRLAELHRRGVENGLAGLERVDGRRLREIEPHVRGEEALIVPQTGIIDYPAIARCLVEEIERLGGRLSTDRPLSGGSRAGELWRLDDGRTQATARFVVNCAGLHSDRVARLLGAEPGVQIVPFRGEYHRLAPEARGLIQRLVYPVPDPELPFLGVHFTRTVSGEVEVGPNAVLAGAREAYQRGNVRVHDLVDTLTYPGFPRLAGRLARTGLYEELRSRSLDLLVRDLQRLVPDLRREDLVPGGSGVRAQAVDRSGRLVDDFVFSETPGALHVVNAPSPGATSSLALGEEIAGRIPGPGSVR